MFDKDKLDADARRYFDSLPPLTREAIVQSGVDCVTRSELRALAARSAERQKAPSE